MKLRRYLVWLILFALVTAMPSIGFAKKIWIIDSSFGNGTNSFSSPGKELEAIQIEVQNDKKVLLLVQKTYYPIGGGIAYENSLLRFTENGILDTTFGADGEVQLLPSFIGEGLVYVNTRSITIRSDNNILVLLMALSGGKEDYILELHDPDGALVPQFANGGILGLCDITTEDICSDMLGYQAFNQKDNKILVVGSGEERIVIVRLKKDGSLDGVFEYQFEDRTKRVTFSGPPRRFIVKAVGFLNDDSVVVAGQSHRWVSSPMREYPVPGIKDVTAFMYEMKLDGSSKPKLLVKLGSLYSIDDIKVLPDAIIMAGRYNEEGKTFLSKILFDGSIVKVDGSPVNQDAPEEAIVVADISDTNANRHLMMHDDAIRVTSNAYYYDLSGNEELTAEQMPVFMPPTGYVYVEGPMRVLNKPLSHIYIAAGVSKFYTPDEVDVAIRRFSQLNIEPFKKEIKGPAKEIEIEKDKPPEDVKSLFQKFIQSF